MTGSKVNEAYDRAKKCLDQLLSNDQITFYGYVEIMLQLDVMMADSIGIWIPQTDYDGFTYWKCSNCNKKNEMQIFDFCPNCGADMRKGEEE